MRMIGSFQSVQGQPWMLLIFEHVLVHVTFSRTRVMVKSYGAGGSDRDWLMLCRSQWLSTHRKSRRGCYSGWEPDLQSLLTPVASRIEDTLQTCLNILNPIQPYLLCRCRTLTPAGLHSSRLCTIITQGSTESRVDGILKDAQLAWTVDKAAPAAACRIRADTMRWVFPASPNYTAIFEAQICRNSVM